MILDSYSELARHSSFFRVCRAFSLIRGFMIKLLSKFIDLLLKIYTKALRFHLRKQ